MRITFCLPVTGHQPIGGLKVVYEYSNALASRGHSVTLLNAVCSNRTSSLLERISRQLVNRKRYLLGQHRPSTWFALHPDIDYRLVSNLGEQHVPDADVVIATAWQTAEWIAKYPRRKGEKFYFIQSLETWNGPRERVEATWDLPMQKIVISKWLRDIATARGGSAFYVPNGLDFQKFGKDTEIAGRDSEQVLMLYHAFPQKGSSYGIAALSDLKKSYPRLKLDLFGVPARPASLPAWITYHHNPSQANLRRLYNQAAIFVSPSLTEGWGLPPAEAQQCGAAVVATDIGGHREFLVHAENALLAPPRDSFALARHIETLITNPDVRKRLALEGHKRINAFQWEASFQAFESIICSKTTSTGFHISSDGSAASRTADAES